MSARQFRAWLPFLCGVLCMVEAGVVTSAESCALEFRVPLSLAGMPAAQLVGGVTPGLRIIDGVSGRLIWSGAETGDTTQRFVDMTEGFNSSLAAVDTTGDGYQDRIYAGDIRGRLWRFDLDTSAPPSQWVNGGIFADLSDTRGRGFLAAPDITLISPIGALPWISIGIGTAITLPALTALPIGLISHRFYVLRDRAPFERWTQRQYDQWTPLSENMLAQTEGQRLPAAGAAGPGFYVELGGDQVLAPALTLNGNTLFTVAHTQASFLPACQVFAPIPVAVPVSVSSISTLDGSQLDDMNMRIPELLAADSAIALERTDDNPDGPVHCTVAGNTVPGCALDTTLHRSFWRREDAD